VRKRFGNLRHRTREGGERGDAFGKKKKGDKAVARRWNSQGEGEEEGKGRRLVVVAETRERKKKEEECRGTDLVISSLVLPRRGKKTSIGNIARRGGLFPASRSPEEKKGEREPVSSLLTQEKKEKKRRDVRGLLAA